MQDIGIKVLLEGNNLQRLMAGLGVTLWISFLSIGISTISGLVFGIIMTSKNKLIVWMSRIYLETIRIVPQLVLLFLFYFGSARGFNINISGELAAIIVFSLWGTAEMVDLVRGAITSLPKHQFDSGLALGLSKGSLYRYVIIPQVIRRLLPQAINLVTRMIKTSSLVILIGVVEVNKIGQQIIDFYRTSSPSVSLWIYGVIFCIYFMICFPISTFSRYLETIWKE
ncbi:TPA: amino acid ABC transporter permease [Streptococcus suis]|nr:amino acid ABC transporter permease [Streptococcus suis]HEM3642037.1 amino acid ABC transporter permease [Streptococcus suis]HEM3667913.1 amino acid ABC transporter permease [Streptococcus suis]HEM3705241.1 amino acid ABC transporter permease [Streptococcus suis]HEM3721838.1 amino acid ABC transporter permease [Streptococcus suis]